MKRTIPVTILVAGLAVLAVGGLVSFWPHIPLDSAPTTPDAPPTSLVCYGTVDSRHGMLLLQPARAGRVVRVLARENQSVRKGTPLVQLDDRSAKFQEQEATLAVQAAEVQLGKAKSGLVQYQARQAQAEAALEAVQIKLHRADLAVADTERMEKIGAANRGHVAMARDELDATKALIKVEQNKLTELKAVDPDLDVKLAQFQLDRAQVQLSQARQGVEEHVLKAPTDGMVLRVLTQEGDLVGPASPRPAVWFVAAGGWIVRAEVSQEFAGGVREGQEVQVEDEASDRVLAKGRIAELSDWFLPRRQFNALPTGVNTGLTLECVIDLREGHGHLRFGQGVRVRVLSKPATATGEPGKPAPG
jgi:multidrug resistance efflux pump